MLRDTPIRATLLFLLFTLLFSSVIWSLMIWSGHLGMASFIMVTALHWCVALAALVSCSLLGRNFRSLAWGWPENRYIATAYLVPLAYVAIAYGAVWALRLGGWSQEFVSSVAQSYGLRGMPAWGVFILWFLFTPTAGVIREMANALGEEIGWQGFLVPELAKQMSFTKLGLLTGIIWAAWHFPLLLFADYNAGTNRWYAMGCFTVTVVSMSFICSWLRLKSGSLWSATVLHAGHNVFIDNMFDNMMRDTGKTLWYSTELGAALAVVTAGFAFYFWTRRAEVVGPAQGAIVVCGRAQ